MEQGTIYKIENLVNGKVYVGQTVKDSDRRMQVHKIKLKKHYHNNNYLQNAFNKYGEGCFKFSIMEKCSIDDIDDREKYWINHYKSIKKSYNIEGGGNYFKKLAPETRNKIARTTKESWENEEIRKKRLENLPRGVNNWNSRAVICVTEMKIFKTMTEAGEFYGINFRKIQQNASGRNPYCYAKDGISKLEFYYYEKGKEYKPKKHVHKASKAVKCISTNEVFESIAKAAEKYGLETTNISKVCKKKQKHTGKLPNGIKLSWEYV